MYVGGGGLRVKGPSQGSQVQVRRWNEGGGGGKAKAFPPGIFICSQPSSITLPLPPSPSNQPPCPLTRISFPLFVGMDRTQIPLPPLPLPKVRVIVSPALAAAPATRGHSSPAFSPLARFIPTLQKERGRGGFSKQSNTPRFQPHLAPAPSC